jgi:hypothetical protein
MPFSSRPHYIIVGKESPPAVTADSTARFTKTGFSYAFFMRCSSLAHGTMPAKESRAAVTTDSTARFTRTGFS